MLPKLTFALFEFVLLSAVFFAIAICFHGLRQLRPSEQLVRDSRVNLAFLLTEVLVVGPLLAGLPYLVEAGLGSVGFVGVFATQIGAAPFWLQLVLACLVIDGIGYWRHRLMHYRHLWPVHSVHHSDLTVTWLTLARFHPLNRLVSALLLTVGVALLGFPKASIAVGVLFIHYYGYYIHADVPWRYGAFKYVFVSPVLHRWHHSYAEDARDKNFATLFAFYDYGFGTFALPERGVDCIGTGDAAYPQTWLGQLIHPFRVWLFAPKPAKALTNVLGRT
jgi:sterol desaturase/sphingolipid hydroxylase (fatty acid hydroxylase superfamily)